MVLGGDNGYALSITEVFDLRNSSNECTIRNLPMALSGHQAATLNDKVVICGGSGGGLYRYLKLSATTQIRRERIELEQEK